MRKSRLSEFVFATFLICGAWSCSLIGGFGRFTDLEEEENLGGATGDGNGGTTNGDGDGGGFGGQVGTGGVNLGGNGSGGSPSQNCVAQTEPVKLIADVIQGTPLSTKQFFVLAPSNEGAYIATIVGGRMVMNGMSVDGSLGTLRHAATTMESLQWGYWDDASGFVTFGHGEGEVVSSESFADAGSVSGNPFDQPLDDPCGTGSVVTAAFDTYRPYEVQAVICEVDAETSLYVRTPGGGGWVNVEKPASGLPPRLLGISGTDDAYMIASAPFESTMIAGTAESLLTGGAFTLETRSAGTSLAVGVMTIGVDENDNSIYAASELRGLLTAQYTSGALNEVQEGLLDAATMVSLPEQMPPLDFMETKISSDGPPEYAEVRSTWFRFHPYIASTMISSPTPTRIALTLGLPGGEAFVASEVVVEIAEGEIVNAQAAMMDASDLVLVAWTEVAGGIAQIYGQQFQCSGR